MMERDNFMGAYDMHNGYTMGDHVLGAHKPAYERPLPTVDPRRREPEHPLDDKERYHGQYPYGVGV